MSVKPKEEEPKIEIPAVDVETVPEGYTMEEWADLSDAEKEGILDKEPDVGEEEEIDEDVLKEIAGDKVVPEKEVVEVKVEAKKVLPKEEVARETVPEVKVEAPVKEVIASTEILTDDQLLRYRAVVTEAELPPVDNVPVEVQTKFDELDTKYDAGEITLKDYNKERDSLNRHLVMSNVQNQNALRESKAWEKEQAFFLRNRPEYIEKGIRGDAFFGALGQMVKVLGADPKYQGATGMELLIAADRAVKETFGMVPNPQPKPKEEKVAEKVPKPGQGKPPAPLPMNQILADVPNAGKSDIGENWASALDKLTGAAYEAALERLTDEQRTRYLNAG